jgi:uncharacterized protein
MRASRGTITFSPSDLTAYLACEHLTQLELAVARGERPQPERDDPQGDLIRTKGDEHEAAYLESLRAAGRTITTIEIEHDWDWERAARETEEALLRGDDVVYQACFVDGVWRGFADFIVRREDGSYEAVDTKLARHGKPSHVLQLCFYSEQIARVTGRAPQRLHIALGSGETESYRAADFLAYYHRVRDRFVEAVERGEPTEPYPCDHCGICAFAAECEAWWDARDHLVRVAGIRRDQIARLAGAGITTLEQLGRADATTSVPRLADVTFEKLREQAALQLGYRETETHAWKTLAPEVERGFALLPKPSPGDLFFDIEGDPFWATDRGLEYLFGLTEVVDGKPVFHAFWAHDRGEEREMFERFVALIHDRLARDPDLHVYHYAPYETSALKRLASVYATREEEVDDLLRQETFVDLYAVVRQGLRISHPRYSLKNVEQFFMQREAELRAGDDSILLYERWRDEREPSILAAIEAYNEEDCYSTYLLREWLLERKAEAEADWGTTIEWRAPPDRREPKQETVEELEERERVRLALVEHGETLASRLLDYHRREAKPVWWAFFDRLQKTSDQLVEDAEAIGGLELVREEGERRYRLRYPLQQHRLDAGDGVVDPATGQSGETILELDDVSGELVLYRSKSADERALPKALIPGGAWDTRAQRAAVLRFGRSVLAGDGRYPALEKILRRDAPLGGERVQVATVEEARALVERLDGSYLFVQGPPGAGKTYTGARLIVHLLARGKRVGVSATSHRAIHNLLREVEDVARHEGVAFRGLKKSSGAASEYTGPFITSSGDNGDFCDEDVQLVAGTAWLLSRAELDRTLDYVVVDEAGQVSLADVLAIGTSARSVILLGDPLQLAQVTQGLHPDGSGASALEHLLGTQQTIDESHGLFLEQTWRMHPDVCRFISDAFYDSRLHSVGGATQQSTEVGTGLRFLPVEHAGNRRSSLEEAEAIRDEVRRLVGREWTNADGVTAPLRVQDILVVAPYNEQVGLLTDVLGDHMRVGTVDKFQGQEAAVVFFSMATSSGADVPRNLEFLFSRNRLNVAVSRAKCLAYVVASPRLLEIGCRSVEQMRLANALCLFVEEAERQVVVGG